MQELPGTNAHRKICFSRSRSGTSLCVNPQPGRIASVASDMGQESPCHACCCLYARYAMVRQYRLQPAIRNRSTVYLAEPPRHHTWSKVERSAKRRSPQRPQRSVDARCHARDSARAQRCDDGHVRDRVRDAPGLGCVDRPAAGGEALHGGVKGRQHVERSRHQNVCDDQAERRCCAGAEARLRQQVGRVCGTRPRRRAWGACASGSSAWAFPCQHRGSRQCL